MEGDAHVWALPHLEELGNGGDPFGNLWNHFLRDFTKRFMPQDINETVREALKQLKQGKDSVAEYMSKFDQFTGQTGWSNADHRQRFYDGLTDAIKDALSYSDRPVSTFDDLRDSANKVDMRIRARQAEKRGGSSHPHQPTPVDPNAMQVDATKQQQGGKKDKAEYMKFMHGKCFGCGSKEHTKKQGNHERDVCNHCGKTGHRGPVCSAKFMGKPGKAKAASTTDSTSSTDNTASSSTSSSTASATTNAPAKDNKSQADLLAKLMEQMKAQEAQINALKASF